MGAYLYDTVCDFLLHYIRLHPTNLHRTTHDVMDQLLFRYLYHIYDF